MGYMARFKEAERARPVIIETTHGPMDERLLVKKIDGNAVEYYLDGELVHRSATVELKGVLGSGQVQGF